MSDPAPTEDAAIEAAREKFLASLADPPDNVAVEIEKEAAAAEADGPKASTTSQTPSSTVPNTSASAAKSAAVSNGKATAEPPVSSADAVLAALKSGDLDAIADLTGADPADFDEKSVRWAARNRREASLKKDIEKVRADARQILEHYEPIDTQLEAFDASGGKDWAPVRAIVEHVTGKPWAVAAAQLGLVAPAQPGASRSPAADRVLLEAVRDDVPDDHQVRQLPGWEHRVVQILQENVDETTGEPAISFKQAAARAVRRAKEEHAKLAPIFGGGPAPAARAATPERADTPAPGTKRRLTKDEFYARYDRAGK